MRILWVKPGKLLPLDSGGKLRTYNILRHLSSAHDVSLLTYYEGERDAAYEEALAREFANAIPMHTGGSSRSGFGRVVDYLRHLADPAPYAVSRFTHPAVRERVTSLLSGGGFDVAISDFLASAGNFPQALPIPTVLFEHNVEALLWKRRAQFEERWVDRMVARFEYWKMRRCETAHLRRFHHVIAVSDVDREALTRMAPRSGMTVVPTGVDVSKFSYEPVDVTEPIVVFTGSMDWNPNIDGVEYFCRDVWPSVLARVPDARLQIVGRDPHPRVRRLASPSVEVTGTVQSVVEHLRAAAVLVVPLRIGGGTRIKIYEGMALGKPTVSTSIGAEGLDVRPGHDIVLADAPAPFADAIVELLRDPALRRRYGAAAAATARGFDWSNIAERFADTLQGVITASGATPGMSTRIEPVRA